MPIDQTLQKELRAIAHKLADLARPETLRFFRKAPKTFNKHDDTGFDPVTEADRAAEQVMRDYLDKTRPEDAILGEEFGAKSGSSGLMWVLDPIDGTRGYISGTPTWGVLISVSDQNGPLFGLIDQPYIGERFEGGFGHASLTGPHGTAPLQSGDSRPLSDAIVFSTFPNVGSKIERTAFQDVASRAKLTRYGMDCYAYALIATGQIDLVIEAGLQPYDIHAPIAVVQAAGGIVTDWQGRPAHDGGRVLAAANQHIHTEALNILKGY